MSLWFSRSAPLLPGCTLAYACAAVTILAITSCAGAARTETTFLRSVDLIEMTDRMAESFAQTPAVAARAAGDEPWVVSIHRMANHTNEVIPEREKWLYVARLRAMLGSSALARDRSIIWIIPRERWSLVEDELGDAPPELRMKPTHQLSAEFTALTHSTSAGRSDTYLCEYRLVKLDTGQLTWTDAWEVKRSISGLTYD